MEKLVVLLEGDVELAREVLAAHVGKVFLTPTQEGPRRFYVATGAFDLSLVLSEGNEPRRVLENRSFGGRI